MKSKPEVSVANLLPKVDKPTHRYYCEACSGTAFLHNINAVLPARKTCKNCNKMIDPIKKENLILL